MPHLEQTDTKEDKLILCFYFLSRQFDPAFSLRRLLDICIRLRLDVKNDFFGAPGGQQKNYKHVFVNLWKSIDIIMNNIKRHGRIKNMQPPGIINIEHQHTAYNINIEERTKYKMGARNVIDNTRMQYKQIKWAGNVFYFEERKMRGSASRVCAPWWDLVE